MGYHGDGYEPPQLLLAQIELVMHAEGGDVIDALVHVDGEVVGRLPISQATITTAYRGNNEVAVRMALGRRVGCHLTQWAPAAPVEAPVI